MTKDNMTLEEVLVLCEEALSVYSDIIDESDPLEETEELEDYEAKYDSLYTLIKRMRDQLDVNQSISFSKLIMWLNAPKHKEIKPIILNALQVCKKVREKEIEKLKQDVAISDEILQHFSSEIAEVGI